MLADYSSCTGCAVCAAVYPADAVKWRRRDGFRFPAVEESLCVGCGLCEEACAVLKPPPAGRGELTAYSGHFEDVDKVLRCASGGFMTALAERFVREGGVVYGVCWDESFAHAVYRRATTLDEILPMRTSKYVMSEPDEAIWKSFRSDIETGRQVLFTGCPCEIGAARRYLGREYDNLTTCEVICAGGTTPLAMEEFVRELRDGHPGFEIAQLNMRKKKNGVWKPKYIEAVSAEGEVISVPFAESDFCAMFDAVKRPCCYDCRFKLGNSGADFTAGDHYGENETDPGYCPAGMSVIFAQSDKGRGLLRRLDFPLWEETLEKAAGTQACLDKSLRRSALRETLLEKMEHEGLRSAADCYRSSKLNGFDSVFDEAGRRIPDTMRRFGIWGVGNYFEITYGKIKEFFPDAEIVGIFDKYKRGTKHGMEIRSPDDIRKEWVDHVFITTVMGKDEAVQQMREKYGNDCEAHYTLSMIE